MRRPRTRGTPFPRPVLALVCTLILAAVLFALFPPLLWQADFTTDKGQRRTFRLADGSTVTLNTASALAVKFDGLTRRVELLTGEAFFEVARDAIHPFVVSAGESRVRAMGTAFSVLRQDSELHVELLDGLVEVEDARHLRRAYLQVGQIAHLRSDALQVQTVTRAESLALWREGYLHLEGVPLREAVAQINRYRPGRVILLNDRLGDRRVSGLFRLDALDQALDTLTAAVPGLRKIPIAGHWVLLR